jgi:hypothetical protein
VKRRRQSSGSRSKPRTARAKYDCLDILTGDEAQTVLNELLSSRPDLISDARRAANALLATVSFADVAADVLGALQALDLDDLDAGPRPGGYVEPSEAAWSVIEKVVTPYFHDLERRVKLRHEDEALEVCKGIVLGLYRAEHRGFELLEYAEDSPSELASHVVEIWRRRRRRCTFPRNFVEKYAPNLRVSNGRTSGEASSTHQRVGTAVGLKFKGPAGSPTTHAQVTHQYKLFIFETLMWRVGFVPVNIYYVNNLQQFRLAQMARSERKATSRYILGTAQQ